MAIKVYNTMGGEKEIFRPLHDKNVKIFVCGPTVQDYAHIGHAKTYVQFDVVVKYLRYRKYNVFYLQNVTDIDDKIINRAKELKKLPYELANEYEKSFYEDMKALKVDSVNKYARATDHINEIVSQVLRLIKLGYAYKIKDGYYFDLSKFPSYGKLSGRTTLEAEDSVSRIDESINKKNKGDFCLLKFSKEGETYWAVETEIEVSDGEYDKIVKNAIKDNDEEFLKLNKIDKTKWKV
ncbi:MAG: class I tRNA ligase family protein [Nanoarchaeota archaeon]